MRHLGLSILSIVTVACATTLLPVRRAASPVHAPERTLRIALIDHGYHMGIIVPVRTAWYDLGAEFGLQGAGDVVEIGWGDRSFYMNEGFSVGKAWSALFWGSTGSVMHLWRRDIDTLHDVGFDVTPGELLLMVQAIRRTAQRNAQGRPVIVADGYYGRSSAFVAANANYHVFNTCNQWTSDVLLHAGRSMPLWCPMPESVMWSAERQR